MTFVYPQDLDALPLHVMQGLAPLDERDIDNDFGMPQILNYPHQNHDPLYYFPHSPDNGPYIQDYDHHHHVPEHRYNVEFPPDNEPTIFLHNPYFQDHTEDSVELPIPREMTIYHEDGYETKPPCDTSKKLPSFVNILPEYLKPSKKTTTRRGRPPTYQKPGYIYSDNDSLDSDGDRSPTNSPTHSRCRKGAKNILLWKFLLEELRKPAANHIQWVTERDGVFKFVDTAECSRLWGLKKKKEDMNFEKLSRGIRHYYKDGLMSRVDGTRLVYQFNWTQVPRAYRCYGK